MIDFKTGIELANSHADARMVAFNQCRFPKRRIHEVSDLRNMTLTFKLFKSYISCILKSLLPTKFRELFHALPPDKIHPEVNAIVWAVISHYSPTEVEQDERRMV